MEVVSGSEKNCYFLFTDVSLHPQRRLGVGGYLLVPASFLECTSESVARSEIAGRLLTKRFMGTSATELEIKTILWALHDYQIKVNSSGTCKLQIYSDSQCVSGLLRRRSRLESTDYLSKKSKQLLKNSFLYRQFYKYFDAIDFSVHKVTGHSPSSSHDTIHRVFSCVDSHVRKELKLWVNAAQA